VWLLDMRVSASVRVWCARLVRCAVTQASFSVCPWLRQVQAEVINTGNVPACRLSFALEKNKSAVSTW
jgi:hypothetical protein